MLRCKEAMPAPKLLLASITHTWCIVNPHFYVTISMDSCQDMYSSKAKKAKVAK